MKDADGFFINLAIDQEDRGSIQHSIKSSQVHDSVDHLLFLLFLIYGLHPLQVLKTHLLAVRWDTAKIYGLIVYHVAEFTW